MEPIDERKHAHKVLRFIPDDLRTSASVHRAACIKDEEGLTG